MTTNYHPIIDRMKLILDLLDTFEPGGSSKISIEEGTIEITNLDINNNAFDVPHTLENVPFYAAIWLDDTTGLTGNHVVGGQSFLLENDTIPALYPVSHPGNYYISKEGYYMENDVIKTEYLSNSGNFVKNFTSNSVSLTASSSYPCASGTYHYMFIAFKEI